MNIANRLTILRILLIPIFLASLLYWRSGSANYRFLPAGLYLVACLTDALDGMLARGLRQKTRFGTLLDPMADKLLLLTGYFTLATFKSIPIDVQLPAWLTLIVISRDVIILAGALTLYLITGKLEP